MTQAARLQHDAGFRRRLILACLGVSLFVSLVYSIVSYRLAADVGVNTELASMDNFVEAIFKAVPTDFGASTAKDNSLIVELVESNETTKHLLVLTSNSHAFSQILSNSDLITEELIKQVRNEGMENRALISFNNESYLYVSRDFEQLNVLYIRQATSLDLTLSYVSKRILITTLIVFWISVWLALTMSSIIDKEVKNVNRALTNLATHDVLTGLPNRLFLLEELDKVFSGEKSQSEADPQPKTRQGCLFVIDLDKFKEVNDAFGHTAGDKLLKDISTRVLKILKKDQLLVRIGGDEFVIWVPHMSISKAQKLAANLVSVCEKPVLIDNLSVNTGASVGVAHYPTHATSRDALIVNADTAMYKAKNLHSGWHLYNTQDSVNHKQGLQLRADVSEAFEKHQLVLFYQPKIELKSGNVIGLEGLCRWQHPSRGLLMPADFIDIIGSGGRVQEFGRYIISQAITQIAKWQQVNIIMPVAINLSPYNLLDPGIIAHISQELDRHSVPPSMLEIELTENETSLNITQIESVLIEMKNLGLVLAIDDFGTGMSSFSYIANLHVDAIKIDRVFINDLNNNDNHQAIVNSTILLASAFDCKLIAEGVETIEQANKLMSLGCQYAQGYLFAKPLSVKDITQKLSISRQIMYDNSDPSS